MNIVEMNIGEKIGYKINGKKITLRDELTLDLSKYEIDLYLFSDETFFKADLDKRIKIIHKKAFFKGKKGY